ncbi:MAG TPA: transcriptional coactivator p15 [Nitrospirae bacterium]|nr:transcriptional coactivator p15 [Nitrospirota bacterium]HDZ88840.1 transcriptional coactivator p15 [Nitrospirota bacterium]
MGEIERNPTERLRVSTESFKGRDYIDLRIYYEANDGEWKPTKKGVTIAPEKTEDVIKLLEKAGKQLSGK